MWPTSDRDAIKSSYLLKRLNELNPLKIRPNASDLPESSSVDIPSEQCLVHPTIISCEQTTVNSFGTITKNNNSSDCINTVSALSQLVTNDVAAAPVTNSETECKVSKILKKNVSQYATIENSDKTNYQNFNNYKSNNINNIISSNNNSNNNISSNSSNSSSCSSNNRYDNNDKYDHDDIEDDDEDDDSIININNNKNNNKSNDNNSSMPMKRKFDTSSGSFGKYPNLIKREARTIDLKTTTPLALLNYNFPFEGGRTNHRAGLGAITNINSEYDKLYYNVSYGSYNMSKIRCSSIGLINLGNTCYMNTIIQCLSNTPYVKKYIINNEYLQDPNYAPSELFYEFSSLIVKLWNSTEKINPEKFHQAMVNVITAFNNNEQQDADEFMGALLKNLNGNISLTNRRSEADQIDQMIREDWSSSDWQAYFNSYNTALVSKFYFVLKCTLSCTECHYSKANYEPFLNIALGFPNNNCGKIGLEELLKSYVQKEVVTTTERCPACEHSKLFNKSYSFLTLPKYLVLVLKRFNNADINALKARVEFSTELDIKQYTEPSLSNSCTKYHFYATAEHYGQPHSGHYVATCKVPNTDEWFRYNDARISSVTEFSHEKVHPYMFFFELIDDA